MKNEVAVILLNWNGATDSIACIKALLTQTASHDIIAVDNGSTTDTFAETVKNKYQDFILLENDRNKGFAGGVNTGIRYAQGKNYKFIALINNDALPNKDWLSELLKAAKSNKKAGIITGKLLQTNGLIDSTGDTYSSWGLPYPRGRDEKDNGQYDKSENIFGATGGASLYKIEMLNEIGLFDEDFFAYYEDVDLSFRAQLRGWRVIYTPRAIAYHKGGATSKKIPGLTAYMTIKNLPWLLIKNLPLRLIPKVLPRFIITYLAIIFSALSKTKFIPVIKGLTVSLILIPKKIYQRHSIQSGRTVSTEYIKSIILYDLPDNAHNLRKVRTFIKKFMIWR